MPKIIRQLHIFISAAATARLLQSCPTLCNPRQQPTRLLHPWNSPGKNTGVGCYFLLQCMKVKSESEVSRSCLTLSDPMDCSLPGSSVHGIFQARVLEWVAIAFYNFFFLIYPFPRMEASLGHLVYFIQIFVSLVPGDHNRYSISIS